MSVTTLELSRLQQINVFDGFDELDAFDQPSNVDDNNDGTIQLIEAIAAERDYSECAYYDSAW